MVIDDVKEKVSVPPPPHHPQQLLDWRCISSPLSKYSVATSESILYISLIQVLPHSSYSQWSLDTCGRGQSSVQYPTLGDYNPACHRTGTGDEFAGKFDVSSVESQKGAITIQRCSVENQKGTITIQRCSIEWLRTRRALSPWTLYSDSALLVLNGTSLNIYTALLALNWRHSPYLLIDENREPLQFGRCDIHSTSHCSLNDKDSHSW